MILEELFADKALKPKERTDRVVHALEEGTVGQPDLIAFADTAKGAVKASCIEALEYISRTRPAFISAPALDLCLRALGDKEPRVKWEAARVIGNAIHRFPDRVEEAVPALLAQAAHEGTVVRWSAAYALAQVIGMGTTANKKLVPAATAIARREEKDSIRKIYEAAIKRALK